jgi:DNA invertase Pin-like site-specific DNA recombinase
MGMSHVLNAHIAKPTATQVNRFLRALANHAGLSEFERDLIRERVKPGLAAARARGVKLGRQHGQRPSDKKPKRVLAMHKEGLSYRMIGRNIGLSKNMVMEIVKREVVQPS